MNSFRRRSSRHFRSNAIVAPSPTLTSIEQYPKARIVQIRLVFLHLGEIDTLNEKYQAEIYFEARWIEKFANLNTLNLDTQQQTQLLENAVIKIEQFSWSPQLFVENAIGQIGAQDRWITIRRIEAGLEICEHRRMNGIFWEKLELSHFPADVQDLSISITSHHPMEKCLLIPDRNTRSFINREAFTDQQEWSLYEHVTSEQRRTKEEYSFEFEDSYSEEKDHAVVDFTCRAARRPGYYYWNGFCLIFLITLCSFCIFSIPPNLPQNRLQITCTLVLTSITFRWVVNRTLPQISYLTTLDIYGIISIFILVILCIWHAIIAAVIFLQSIEEENILAESLYVVIDRYVFVGLFVIFIFIHIFLFVWFFVVAYGRRREMVRLDRLYVQEKENQSRENIRFRRSSSTVSAFQTMKIQRPIKQNDGLIMIPNGSTFLPIQEVPSETRKNTITMMEIQEPEDQ